MRDWLSSACGCVLLLLASTPAFPQAVSEQLVIRFAPGVLTPPSGQVAGSIREFSFTTRPVRDALESAGIEYLARLFPDFRTEDRFSVNFIGEPVLLDDLSGYYRASLRTGTAQAVNAEVRSIPGVIDAEWTPLRRALSADPLFPKQWGLENTQQALCPGYDGVPLVSDKDINAPEAWAITTGDTAVRIGILDTGIHASHEDFQGRVNLAEGVSFTPVMPPGAVCNGGVPDLPWDDNGHGTIVTGIAAASGGQDSLGVARGVAGVAWRVKPIAIKMMDCGGVGGADKSAQAMDWARTRSIPVLSMSYGDFGPFGPERSAARNAFYAGALLVAASGNEDNGFPRFPARYGNTVCAVGAYFANGRRWINRLVVPNAIPPLVGGSCWGPALDLAAPGGRLIATTNNGARLVDNGYDDLATCSRASGGTSSAAPVVSGIAGLILSKYRANGPNGQEALLGEDVYQTMIITARHPDVDAFGVEKAFDDSAGFGHVRADTALKFLALPRQIYHHRVVGLTMVDTLQSLRRLKNIPGLPSADSMYMTTRWRMRKVLSFNPTFSSSPVVWPRSSGSGGAKDTVIYDYDEEVYWGRIVAVSAAACTVETNVFRIHGVSSLHAWFPILPSKAAVALTAVGVPVGGGPFASGQSRDEEGRRGADGHPMAFALHQSRPNPFETETTIRFELPVRSRVRLDVFDAQGRLVRSLTNAELPVGFHAVSWDRCDSEGSVVKPGVYLYRLQAGRFRGQKKMVLLAR